MGIISADSSGKAHIVPGVSVIVVNKLCRKLQNSPVFPRYECIISSLMFDSLQLFA
jgi:hypothetical protein